MALDFESGTTSFTLAITATDAASNVDMATVNVQVTGKIQDSEIQKHLFDNVQPPIIQINETMWKQNKYFFMGTCLETLIKALHGRYHKGHQRMFVAGALQFQNTTTAKNQCQNNKWYTDTGSK